MTKKLSIALASALLIILPALSLAGDFIPPSQPNVSNNGFNVNFTLGKIFDFFWPLVVAIIIIMFVVIGLMFLTARGNEGQVATARQAVIWAIVGIIVLLLGFGILATVSNYLGLGAPAPVTSGGGGATGGGGGAPIGACCVGGIGNSCEPRTYDACTGGNPESPNQWFASGVCPDACVLPVSTPVPP